jgi:serine/threonine protein kinase
MGTDRTDVPATGLREGRATLSTAIRGTVLAGRYRLEERIQSNTDGALWRAVDATLDRRVSIRVMRPGHPFAADVADAARRAALIDDDRLVRVLDVGSDGEIGFVVSEDVDGDSLAVLVERSPLAPPVVRRIVGEVSQGLEAAAVRGLHHLCLTPRSVIVCRDGSVKIVGTAVEAAATGLEPAHAATASRDDATALVGLLYSGLTGRWPLGNTGFPPAPRGEGGAPVPPADLVRGIPNDLDTLCVVTLGGSDDGPRSPAELARELAPWPSAEEAPLRAAPRRLPSDAPPAPLDANSPLKMRSRPVTKRGTSPKSTSKPPASPEKSAVTKEIVAASGAEAAADSRPPTSPAPRRSATMFPPSVALTGSLPIPKEPDGRGPRRMDSLFSPAAKPERTPEAPAAPAAPAEPTAPAKPFWAAHQPVGQPPAAPGAQAPSATTPPAAKTSPAGRITAPPADPTPKAPREAKPKATGKPKAASKPKAAGKPPSAIATATGKGNSGATANGRGSSNEPMLPWSQAWSQTSSPPAGPEVNVPFPIVIPAETPPREQSRLVIFSITVVLVLGLVVAVFSLRDLGSSDNQAGPSKIGAVLPTTSVGAIDPTAEPTAAPSTEPASPTPTEPTPTPTPTKAVPVSIASIRAIDPQGDGDEDSASTPLAVDGDGSTSWHSQTYRNSTFSGLKRGLGLSLKLKRSASLKSATIDLSGVGGTVEVYTASRPEVASATLIGKGTAKNGRISVDVKDAKASKYVILWFTKLPSVGGSYKLEVSEVRLK